MIQQNKGKIFLADERGHNEIEWFRSYNMFNFGQFRNEHKTPFGPLYVLNDDTLAGGQKISMTVEADSEVLLVPLVGAIAYSDNHGNSTVIEAGECQVYATPKDSVIQISNPYESELVNFLQIWFYRSSGEPGNIPQAIPFDIINNKNQLVPIPATDTQFNYSIGKFAGREEAIYKLSNPDNGVFVFVIEGAFEVQYRLLHARDGLALWEADEIEMEALSNDAIILVMEVPL
ncbi:pirin [Niastella caeni]|uniref:Pirin n=1 Tax=Niastella caeni TaxID=2569763 RepID=A0A4S8HYC7_9BACT|nr:pirin [Niastella caeni]THU39174.1 pirin [Niastella caeni]